jgi:glycosyltransferase involved in cell wall biosynthesis
MGEFAREAGGTEGLAAARFEGKPVRILHVLGGMDRGGVETWLMHVLRHIDRERFRMDFLVHTDRRCSYDDEIEALGSRIYFCPAPSNPIRYARNFRRIVREHGPYDVVHSHVHYFSGFVLGLAKAAGVRTRIAHSHSDTTILESSGSLSRVSYVRLSRRMIQDYATWKLAASDRAANSLFGCSWQSELNTLISHCGLDLESFSKTVDRVAIRRRIGFGPDEFVLGHVGRLVHVKNHDFLLRIYVELLKLRPNARLILIGEGPLESTVKNTALNLGIKDRIWFAGGRSDVAELMLGSMDAFIMPSLLEGLGLAAVEAQAAGLPTILSDRIPMEADTRCGLVRFLSLGYSAARWSAEIVQHSSRQHIQQKHAVLHVEETEFNINRNVKAISKFYSGISE